MKATNLGTYSPEEFSIILSLPNGFVHQVSGYGEGTFINITRQIPQAESVISPDGSAARVMRSNTFTHFDLTLYNYSQSRDVLKALMERDNSFKDYRGLFTILAKDNTGRSWWYSDQAYIGEDGEASFSETMEAQTWTIAAHNVKSHQGGNSILDNSTYEALIELGVSPDTIGERWIP